ncbi:DUF2399 domain-containing protein [Streptomyces anulatus]
MYHGDFDWGGLRIAIALLRRVPWRPWRYTAAHYRAAALARPDGPPLAGQPAEALGPGSTAGSLGTRYPRRGRDGPRRTAVRPCVTTVPTCGHDRSLLGCQCSLISLSAVVIDVQGDGDGSGRTTGVSAGRGTERFGACPFRYRGRVPGAARTPSPDPGLRFAR